MSGKIIIERFGGVRPLARRLQVAPSTVQHWKDVDQIPASHQQTVLDCGKDLMPPLQATDFFHPKETTTDA